MAHLLPGALKGTDRSQLSPSPPFGNHLFPSGHRIGYPERRKNQTELSIIPLVSHHWPGPQIVTKESLALMMVCYLRASLLSHSNWYSERQKSQPELSIIPSISHHWLGTQIVAKKSLALMMSPTARADHYFNTVLINVRRAFDGCVGSGPERHHEVSKAEHHSHGVATIARNLNRNNNNLPWWWTYQLYGICSTERPAQDPVYRLRRQCSKMASRLGSERIKDEKEILWAFLFSSTLS